MNADENKVLIGVYLRSSAAINNFSQLPEGLIDTTGLCIRAATGAPSVSCAEIGFR
jgi:hypothetical protein